jgi:hypothetical protein
MSGQCNLRDAERLKKFLTEDLTRVCRRALPWQHHALPFYEARGFRLYTGPYMVWSDAADRTRPAGARADV